MVRSYSLSRGMWEKDGDLSNICSLFQSTLLEVFKIICSCTSSAKEPSIFLSHCKKINFFMQV